MQECVRAVLIANDETILLMRYRWSSPPRELWITPGGRREANETPLETLARELREKLGLDAVEVGPEIWRRHHEFVHEGRRIPEHERFFLVRTIRFEPSAALMEMEERRAFREFRWWAIDDITASAERFAPSQLGAWLRLLAAEGVPPWPIHVNGRGAPSKNPLRAARAEQYPVHMSHRHQRTLEALFQHPPSMNIKWREIVHMFEGLGAETEVVHGGRQLISLNGQRATFSIPHGKSIQSKGEIVAIRHFIESCGLAPGQMPTDGQGEDASSDRGA